MGCPKLAERIRLRHDFLTLAWRRILQRAGVASSIEPLLRLLKPAGQKMAEPQARGDILAVLRAVTALDVSVCHPAVSGNVASGDWMLRKCAAIQGFAARKRDRAKRLKYAKNAFAEAFTPLSQETYGFLGKPAMALLSLLGDMVQDAGRSSKRAFMESAVLELSVALQKGNNEVFRMYNFNYAKVAGHHFIPGDVLPTAVLE